MQRRTFLKDSTLTVFSISAFGAISWNGKAFEGNTPTTTDILGPFYRPGAPMRSNLVLPGSEGVRLTLKGTVLKDDGKTPISDALVEIWHCDEHEVYDNTSDAYNCRGGQKTSVDGRYAFSTIIPVPYKADADNEASWRPAHIHMRVSVPGQQDLVTQIYFKGGKYVDSDPWASTPQAVNRVLPVSSDASGASVVVFDVVLAKEMTLEPKVYERICGIYDMGGGITAEFFRNDDHLMMKRNGQLVASLSYKGNNTFQEGDLYTKARFDLLPDGGTRVTIGDEGKARSGVRYLKYPDR